MRRQEAVDRDGSQLNEGSGGPNSSTGGEVRCVDSVCCFDFSREMFSELAFTLACCAHIVHGVVVDTETQAWFCCNRFCRQLETCLFNLSFVELPHYRYNCKSLFSLQLLSLHF